MSQPIYYVIAEQKPLAYNFSCLQIVEVLAVDFDDKEVMDNIYREKVAPLYIQGR